MRIEHLKEFDIRGHERHQVAFASTLELRRGERAQLAEHAIADECQDLERKIVVAHLLAVMQGTAQKAAGGDQSDARTRPKRRFETRDSREHQSCAHRKEDRAQKTDDAQDHRGDHDRHKRLNKLHHTAHDQEVRPMARLRLAGMRNRRTDAGALSFISFPNVGGALLSTRRERLKFRLPAPQLRVRPISSAKPLMRPALGNAAVFQHEDAIGFCNRRQTMRDHDDGAAFRQLMDNADDGLLAVGIHVRGRFVEYIDGGIVQKRPGKRQTLTLPAREVAALLGHGRIKPARCTNEPVDAATPQNVPKLVIARLGTRHQKIGAHRSGEQVAGERDDGHRLRHALTGNLAEWYAADLNVALETPIAPAQNAGQCGFARTAFADDAGKASGRGGEVDMVEHRALPVIGVGNIAHDDACMREIDAARPPLGLGRIKDGEHLLCYRHAVHCRMEKRAQGTHGDKELRRQEHHAKRRVKGDLSIGELDHRRDDANGSAAEGEHVHHGDGVELHG